MSVATPTTSPAAVQCVCAVTGLSAGVATALLALGKTGFFYSATSGVDGAPSGHIRQLIDGLAELGLEVFVIRIDAGTPWTAVDTRRLERHRVGVDELLRWLDEGRRE